MSRTVALLVSVVVALVLVPVIQGCCLAPTSNPIAAATAGAKILGSVQTFQEADTPEEMADAVKDLAETVADLSTSEIASAVNLVAGEDWSLEDAQSIKDLAAQVDEEAIDALMQADLPSLDEDPEPADIIPVLEEVGITVTEDQIELLIGTLEGLEDSDLAGLIPGGLGF